MGKRIKKAGYATNPKYPQLLIKIIEDYELHKYDKLYNKPMLASNENISSFKSKKTNSKDDFNPILIGAANREIFETNGVKFIYAKNGDTFWGIARDFNIYTWQVFRYNDLKKKHQITEGQKLYLERKKNNASTDYHTVNAGESLYDISQKYGVKLNKICKYNTLKKDANLFPGQRIKLAK
ncbi:MAG: LysM peptidoglycan-binding domain-containing protein [Bacteroidales bacterium]